VKTGFRQVHRWVSIVFSAGVIAYMLALGQGEPPAWLGLFALIPLIVLLVTGLYLFMLPSVVQWRGGRRRGASA
jgi:hypothetical protein